MSAAQGPLPDDGWYYLKIKIESSVRLNDPGLLDLYCKGPVDVGHSVHECTFFKVQGEETAKFLAELFNQRFGGKRLECPDDGETVEVVSFDAIPASSLTKADRFLADQEIKANSTEVGFEDRHKHPLYGPCLHAQAKEWLDEIESERRPDPDTLRRTLPTAIVAAFGIRDLARMCHYYPGVIPESVARGMHEQLLSHFEVYLECSGIPEIGEHLYKRPAWGEPRTEAMMVAVSALLVLNHPDYRSENGTADSQWVAMDQVIRASQDQCDPGVIGIFNRLHDVMLTDCRIPRPPDDPSFQEPQRFLQMFRRYWGLLQEIVLTEMRQYVGTRPHGLSPLINNLNARISECCAALSDRDGIEKAQESIAALVGTLLHGDVDDFGVAEEWTQSHLQQVNGTLDALRISMGGGDYPLTHEEAMCLKCGGETIEEYNSKLAAEWKRIQRDCKFVPVPQTPATVESQPARDEPTTKVVSEPKAVPPVPLEDWGFLDLKVDTVHCEVRRKNCNAFWESERDSAEWHTFLVAWNAGESGATMEQWKNGYPAEWDVGPRKAVKAKTNEKLRPLGIELAARVAPKLVEITHNV